jgi:hypothetical protein
VDIAGPHLQGAEQDVIDQPDHRRAVNDIQQITTSSKSSEPPTSSAS